MRATGAGKIVLMAADVDSPQDAIRRAALESLGQLNMPEGLSVVLRYARPGAHDRTRPVAIAAAKRLMVHDDAAVRAMLAETMGDRERRAWEAAAEQIAAIGGQWATDLLNARLERTKNPGDRERLEGWIAAAGAGG